MDSRIKEKRKAVTERFGSWKRAKEGQEEWMEDKERRMAG